MPPELTCDSVMGITGRKSRGEKENRKKMLINQNYSALSFGWSNNQFITLCDTFSKNGFTPWRHTLEIQCLCHVEEIKEGKENPIEER